MKYLLAAESREGVDHEKSSGWDAEAREGNDDVSGLNDTDETGEVIPS